MRIIIAGGSGLIGRELASALVADGDEVIILSRKPDMVKGMPAGVKVLQWDGKTVQDWGKQIEFKGGEVVQAGKRKFIKIIL